MDGWGATSHPSGEGRWRGVSRCQLVGAALATAASSRAGLDRRSRFPATGLAPGTGHGVTPTASIPSWGSADCGHPPSQLVVSSGATAIEIHPQRRRVRETAVTRGGGRRGGRRKEGTLVSSFSVRVVGGWAWGAGTRGRTADPVLQIACCACVRAPCIVHGCTRASSPPRKPPLSAKRVGKLAVRRG